MPDHRRPLTDNEVHDRLCQAHEALGDGRGATAQGDTALEGARRMLKLMQYAIVAAQMMAEDMDG